MHPHKRKLKYEAQRFHEPNSLTKTMIFGHLLKITEGKQIGQRQVGGLAERISREFNLPYVVAEKLAYSFVIQKLAEKYKNNGNQN